MTELLKISLPDGSVREMEQGSTPADVAAAIGPGLAKAAIAALPSGHSSVNRRFGAYVPRLLEKILADLE